MPETRLLPSRKTAGYFAVKRFDRRGEQRIHMASVSGLLETSHRIPNLDYHILMQLTLKLTQDYREIEKLYRLMCFNVFAHNRDDHSKNFSYLCEDGQWRLSPAYDLTYSNSIGGEHATTVNGNGRSPSREDLLAVAGQIGFDKEKAGAIADEVRERLENGILDMGLLLEPVEVSRYHYVRMPLREKWQVLMRRDWRLAEKQTITPEDLAGVPLIIAKRQSVRNKFENWFGYGREKLHIVSTCNLSHHNQSIMVESGIGAALVMEFVCNQDTLCLRPLEPVLESGCVLVWKKNLTLSPTIQRFIEYVKEYLTGIEKEDIEE